MTRKLRVLTIVLALGLSACEGGGGYGFGNAYYLARAGRTIRVGDGGMSVVTPRAWNRAQRSIFNDVRWVEDWTLNGPYLDGITFVSGMPNGKRLLRERPRADQQVPEFRSNMTAPEITSMLETAFRIHGDSVDFRTLGLIPRPFLGTNGFQYDFEHLDGDELWRKGRAVGAVIDGRLYLILIDAARSHYYQAALPDFEAMAASAQRRR